MLTRLKTVLNNENAGPMTETIIAITVSLAVITSIIYAGICLCGYIGRATDSVLTL